jgi:hypothetical protein
MKKTGTAILLLLVTLCLRAPVPRQARDSSAFLFQAARAADFLQKRFNPSINLVCESDDPGTHWLTGEFSNFKWRYNQTYWLYSDNLFAAYALEPFRPDIAALIKESLRRYNAPKSGLFEAVVGDQIPLICNAADYIVESSSDHVVVARRHDSKVISYGVYADLICYHALQSFLLGRTREAHCMLRQAISLWNGRGLNDWSFRIVDGFHSNQKLALLLYTSKILEIEAPVLIDIEHHLWSMQQDNGGLTALSDSEGNPMGSSNTETTALALLIYNDALIQCVRSKVHNSDAPCLAFCAISLLFLVVTAVAFSPSGQSMSRLRKTVS